jgi:predicted nucleotidyltransferase
MKEKEFWEDWKRKTKIEEAGINSVKSAKKIILENIPKEEIISIYVKGSFARREMNKKSDIDTTTILKSSKYTKKLRQLTKKYGNSFKPEIQFSTYCLWELKTGKKSKSHKGSPSPARILKHIPHYKIIYGNPLDIEKLFKGDDIKIFSSMTNFFKERFIPDYENKKFGFSEIVKQVFWLVENEQRAKGKNPPHHWGKLEKSIKDPNHIVHDTLKFRLHPTKDKKEREKYISKLKKYLEKNDKY